MRYLQWLNNSCSYTWQVLYYKESLTALSCDGDFINEKGITSSNCTRVFPKVSRENTGNGESGCPSRKICPWLITGASDPTSSPRYWSDPSQISITCESQSGSQWCWKNWIGCDHHLILAMYWGENKDATDYRYLSKWHKQQQENNLSGCELYIHYIRNG